MLATTKRHLIARLRDGFTLTTMVPYVTIRVLLATNNSYSLLIAGLRNLFRWCAHISAPVFSRMGILGVLSVTNIRWDTEPSSRVAFTNGRFRCSRRTGNDTCLRGLEASRGCNRGRTALPLECDLRQLLLICARSCVICSRSSL